METTAATTYMASLIRKLRSSAITKNSTASAVLLKTEQLPEQQNAHGAKFIASRSVFVLKQNELFIMPAPLLHQNLFYVIILYRFNFVNSNFAILLIA
jgi:hypothetical protein